MMDSSAMKYAYVDTIDTKLFLRTYYSVTTDKDILQDAVVGPIKKLQSFFSSGGIVGDTLIDISFGHTLFQLFPVCEFFKEIIILDSDDQYLEEVRKWVNKDRDAHDWSFAAKIVMELRNKSESFQVLEDLLRKKVKDILKCDLNKENALCTLELPKADCVIAARILDIFSKDDNAFRRNLNYLSSLLKVGGHLILLADIGISYFIVGSVKYHVLNYDESYLKNALNDEGYLIKCYERIEKEETCNLYDLKRTVFVAAQKQ